MEDNRDQFAFLTRKTTEAYEEVLCALSNRCMILGHPFAPK